MVPNGHLERAGEAPFARTRAAGWDTRWGTAGPGTSWVHQEAHPATADRGRSAASCFRFRCFAAQSEICQNR